MSVKDGRVWCEACRQWLETLADYQQHRELCLKQARLIEYRDRPRTKRSA